MKAFLRRAEGNYFRHFPVISGLIEINPSAREFLFFMFVNVISWSCLAGPVLVLLALHIEMPIVWVGILQSFMPLSMLLVIVTVPLIEFFGPKKVMITTWLFRNLIAMSAFAMPWAIANWGNQIAWYILTGATLGFCVSRAIGAGGWFPWLHEIIGDNERGTYFSTETAITHVSNVTVALGIAIFLTESASLTRFLGVYGFGACAGLISVILITRIPGGKKSHHHISIKRLFASYRKVLGDRTYIHFIIQGALGICFITWFTASIIIYMRKMLLLSDSRVMLASGIGSIGIAITIRFWGRFADHHGSSQAMFLSLFGHSVIALLWLGIIPGVSWSKYMVFPAMLFTLIFSGAFFSVAHRGVLSLIKEDGKIGYTNLWLVSISLALGVTPIMVGKVIEYLDMINFQVCFLISGIGGLICAITNQWIPEKDNHVPARLSDILRPSLPLVTLANIAWITVGLHESNRSREKDSR